jgi:hypothetical protein
MMREELTLTHHQRPEFHTKKLHTAHRSSQIKTGKNLVFESIIFYKLLVGFHWENVNNRDERLYCLAKEKLFHWGVCLTMPHHGHLCCLDKQQQQHKSCFRRIPHFFLVNSRACIC